MSVKFSKDLQYYRFCLYGFLKNLRFFEVFLLLFFLDKGLSFFEIGTLYAIREITINIIEIPTGIVADSVGRRRMMIIAFVFYIFSFVVFYFSATYFLFLLAMILFAFGDGIRSGNHKAMILDYLAIKGWEDQKINYYGHTRSWSQIGSAIASVIGALIVFYTGSYKQIFLFSIIPYLLDLINVVSYPKVLDGNIQKLNTKKIKQNFKVVFKELKYSFKNAVVLKAIANYSFYSGYYKAVKDYLQPVLKMFAVSIPVLLFLDDKQRTAIVIGITFFIIYILNSFASKYSGRIAGKFKNIYRPLNLTLIIGYIAGMISGLFLNYNLSVISIIFFIGILVLENIRKPIGVSYIGNLLDKKIFATTFSVNSQVQTLIAAILAPLIGFFADKFGIGSSLIIVSVVLIITAPVYFVRKNKC
jgi:MFS family permease